MLKQLSKYFVLGCVGGAVYFMMETIWRASHTSHWTMLILGAICFLVLGGLNEFFTWEMPLWLQCLIGAIVVTALEFITGCVLNIWLGWGIWYYDKFHVLHQICLPFTLIWFVLSAVAIIADDYLRYWWFDEEKPHYKIF